MSGWSATRRKGSLGRHSKVSPAKSPSRHLSYIANRWVPDVGSLSPGSSFPVSGDRSPPGRAEPVQYCSFVSVRSNGDGCRSGSETAFGDSTVLILSCRDCIHLPRTLRVIQMNHSGGSTHSG